MFLKVDDNDNNVAYSTDENYNALHIAIMHINQDSVQIVSALLAHPTYTIEVINQDAIVSHGQHGDITFTPLDFVRGWHRDLNQDNLNILQQIETLLKNHHGTCMQYGFDDDDDNGDNEDNNEEEGRED